MSAPSPLVHPCAAVDALSARARVVVGHVLAGRSNKWIALELELSEPTVSRLVRGALHRLGAASVTALARIANARAAPDAGLAPITTPPLARLNRSERDVVRLLLEGGSNAAFAARRGTSPRTVAHQLTGIYAKVGVASRRELVARLG